MVERGWASGDDEGCGVGKRSEMRRESSELWKRGVCGHKAVHPTRCRQENGGGRESENARKRMDPQERERGGHKCLHRRSGAGE
eukprot:3077272-Rhodomonas_salina.1